MTPVDVAVYMATEPVDLRAGFDKLAALVRATLKWSGYSPTREEAPGPPSGPTGATTTVVERCRLTALQ